ncbi:30S ribosomal protein S6e [Candidatus Micrarchaeota archaeon]|nr:30S ribosomal protein S6e [Candidatus Micrarchaeota archaeon]
MKIVFNDPKTGMSFQKEVDKAKSGQLVGKKIGDEIPGAIIGLDGYTLKITGGSTADGVPMRFDIPGQAKTKALLPSGPGIHPKYLDKGIRIKKRVAGNTVAVHTAQVNAVISTAGAQPLDALGFTPKPKDAKKAEEKK